MQYTRRFDNYLVAVLFLSSGLVLHNLLNIQYDNPFSNSEKIELGKIVNIENNVRTKSIENASWLEAKKSNQIFNNDKIFTDEGSSATISFKSGNELLINEDSLIKLEMKNNVFNLNVEKGSFLANLNSDSEVFLLLVDGKEYKLKSKKGSIKISDKKLSVLSGQAIIVSDDKQITLDVGQVTNLDRDQIQVFTDFPHDLNFVESQRFYTLKDKPSVITWKHNNNLDIYISKDDSFTNSKIFKSQGEKLEFIPQEGINYIKFYDHQTKEFSSVKSLEYIFEKEPEIEISEGPYFKGQSVNVTILDSEFDKYNVYQNNKLIEINSKSFVVALDQVGEYSIYVKGVDEKRPLALKSKVTTINVLPLPVTGPKVVSPQDAQEFYFYQNDKVSINVKPDVDLDFGLILNGQEIALASDSFNFDVDKNMTLEIKSFYKVMSYRIESDPIQVFIFIDDFSSDESSGKKFILKKPGQDVEFNWDKKDLGQTSSKYLLEISKSANFNAIDRRVETSDENLSIKFEDVGERFWRVKIIKSDGKVEFSKPKKLILLKPTPPPSPQLKKVIQKRLVKNSIFWKIINFLFPPALAQDDVEESDKLEWEKIEGVEKYKIEILNLKTNKIEKSKIQKENFFSLDALKPGNYKYRVASIDYWGQQGEFSDYFELEIKKISREIKLVAPKHMSILSSEKVNFEWESDDIKDASYLVEISHDLSFQSAAKYPAHKNSLQINLSNFQGQKIYWRVTDLRDTKSISKRRLIFVQKDESENKMEQKISIAQKNFSFYFYPNKKLISKDVGTKKIEIDGIDLISFGFIYSLSNEYKLDFEKSSGKVFKDLDYASNDLSFLKYWNNSSWDFAFGANIKYATSYSIKSNKIQMEREFLVNGVGLLRFNKEVWSYEARVFLGQEVGAEVLIQRGNLNWYLLNSIAFKARYLSSDSLGSQSSLGLAFIY